MFKELEYSFHLKVREKTCNYSVGMHQLSQQTFGPMKLNYDQY